MQQLGIYRCMSSGTRSNKEKDWLFSDDPAHLERTICRGQRFTSLDATTSLSIDTHNQPSTDTRPSSSIDPNRSTTIDTTPRTSIDTVSSKMVNTGRERKTGTVIPDADATGAAQPSYSNSYYQNPPPQTQECKIEEMLDRVLLDNNKSPWISTTGETIKRQEAFAREAGADKGKHHVNAIIDDDFWQVVRNEKLEEGDFEIESSMSLGGSQWCRPMSMNSHRSTYHDEDRWMDYSSHRSTSSTKSTECNAVRILTHEEFAAKHPHPPSPFYDRIDRSVEPTIDRQSESDVDRHNTPPIDRRAPLTYQVRLPSIDNDYINALRPPPKPLANPPKPKPNPLNSSPESVQEEQEAEGRRLRKRKEKIPKNLKREANDKEMDGFIKRILRIPIGKPFDEAYFTHRLWMFFRETKVTEEDIRRMFHQVREKMKHRITLTKKSDHGKFAIPCVVKGVEFPHSMCDTGASRKVINSVDYGKELGFIGACHCGAEYESEYETEYSESIDTPTFPSIDSNESTVTNDHNNTSLDVMHPVDHFAPPNHCYQHFALQPPSKRGHDDYSIGSWIDSGFHESFAVDTDERHETHKFTNTFPTSFDDVHSTSVNTHPRPTKQPLKSIDTHTGTSIDIRAAAKIQEQENIPSPTRDPYGNARAMDGRILQVSREDIADILQVANGPDNLFSQQRGTPDVIQTDSNNHVGVATTEINPDLSCQPKRQASIDRTTET
ncbi:hypothetical protein IGI04_025523 [Brassica rapa subsp. trilocularis]|uniref:Uncharacterized protein n=1 Tax=Brassica rapa subsp. trilocularis TaxID=1813537 RepID=A0ABQ7KVZ2_BRACM|nr:hypothetical protein IGI04_025523 [Brassica rapa subsp. trilocularis]